MQLKQFLEMIKNSRYQNGEKYGIKYKLGTA